MFITFKTYCVNYWNGLDRSTIKKRLLSFLWRLGGIVAVQVIAWIAANINLFHLSPQVTLCIGLVLNEITKHLNQKQQLPTLTLIDSETSQKLPNE